MDARRLTIAIDASAASHPQPGGFKSYVRSLLWGLSRVDRENQYRVYVDRPAPDLAAASDGRFRLEVVRPRLPLVGPVLREQALLPARTLLDRPDVAHFPAGRAPAWHPAPKVVTIHDAIEHMPREVTGAAPASFGTKRWLMHLYDSSCQRLAARTAAIVLTVSECSRRDIVRYLRVPEQRIRVVPGAPGPGFRRLNEGEAPIGMESEQVPFVLGIASADPRKNLASLIRAYAALPSELVACHRLVLVWTHRRLQGQLLDLARRLGVLGRIASVVAPTDDALCQLYSAATVFVFPSLYEGFGLPPLEAMACATPVIASNTSSLPEVLGDGALLVAPGSVPELTRALAAVLSDDALRAALSARGLARAARFSWERAAARTVSAYEEVAAGAVARSSRSEAHIRHTR